MAVPLSPEHTFLILEAGRRIDDRQADNFYDHVAHELSANPDPSAEDVTRAIQAAQRAMARTVALL